MNSELKLAIEEMKKGINCLYIATHEDAANNIWNRFERVEKALNVQPVERTLVTPVDGMKERLAEHKKAFVFVCEKDMRLATPDYAKYRSALYAFSAAEALLEENKILCEQLKRESGDECEYAIVWDTKHSAFWRPDAKGYTLDHREAGAFRLSTIAQQNSKLSCRYLVPLPIGTPISWRDKLSKIEDEEAK